MNRTALRTFVLALLAALAVVPAASARADDAVPYDDPAVTGSVGFCDVNGHNVYSGHVTDTPFVWRAVGTTAAAGEYAKPGGTAFIGAYQPRQGYDPGDWSGYVLNAPARYSNVAHPMAQSTPLSDPLNAFLERYPPKWQGIVQIRLLLGGVNRSPQLSRYDATDILVTGDTWRVVRGGTGPCSSGQAVSQSVILNLPGAKGTPSPGAVKSPPSTSGSPATQVSGSARGIPLAGDTSTATQPAANRAGIKGGSLAGVIGAAAGAGVLIALLVVWAVRRRGRAA